MPIDPHAAGNAAAFDQREYDREFEAHRHRVECIARVIRAHGPFDRGADIGCFGGVATKYYEAAGIARMDGFDVSPVSVEHMRARGRDAYLWEAGAAPCPAASGTYDVLIASEVIEHVVDTESALAEMKRVLKPGGWLILTTPNLTFWLSRLRMLAGKSAISMPSISVGFSRESVIDVLHVRIGTLDEWRALLEHMEFEVRNISATSYLQSYRYPRKWLGWIDRQFSRRPSLGGNVIVAATTKA
jgi:SAM-dependent methyltransferase